MVERIEFDASTQPEDNDHRGRLLWAYNQTQEEDWDSYGAHPTTEDAFNQAQAMITLMESVFDKDVLDHFFVAPFSGGFSIEFMDPTESKHEHGMLPPSSSFDTTIDENGSVNFWRSHNLHWNGHSLQSDYEFESEFEMPDADNATVIEAWMNHAREFNDHMKEKMSD